MTKLSHLPSNSFGELNILRHYGNPLSVNGTKIGVFEESHQVSLCSFLERGNDTTLKPYIRLEILSDFTNQTVACISQRLELHRPFFGNHP